MEVTSSAVTGAIKIGVQIVSSHKAPMLEIYHQVRNTYGPEQEFEIPLSNENRTYKSKHRFQDIFVEFTLVNIGGSRAENIKLSYTGDLKRSSPRESFGDLFEVVIPQMAPGQTRYLFKFYDFDLEAPSNTNARSLEFKDESFTITIEYDSGRGLLNRILSLWSKMRGRRRYKNEYTFFPNLVSGDLPPPEYA